MNFAIFGYIFFLLSLFFTVAGMCVNERMNELMNKLYFTRVVEKTRERDRERERERTFF